MSKSQIFKKYFYRVHLSNIVLKRLEYEKKSTLARPLPPPNLASPTRSNSVATGGGLVMSAGAGQASAPGLAPAGRGLPRLFLRRPPRRAAAALAAVLFLRRRAAFRCSPAPAPPPPRLPPAPIRSSPARAFAPLLP
jgi:hypothetical protein